MSTKLGVIYKNNPTPIVIAFRWGIGNNKVKVNYVSLNAAIIADLLPDETPIVTIDNTNQGIDTLKQLKEAIKESDNEVIF